MLRIARILLLVPIVLTGTSATAVAADPASGSVSNASPSVTWTGTLAEGFLSYNAFNNNPELPCVPPSCDSFDLDVQDPGQLTILVELQRVGSSGAADAGLRLTTPDGTQSFQGGPSEPGKPAKFVFKNAAKGAYVVDITDSFGGTPGDYKATATLGAGAPAPVTPPTQPAPQPGPGDPQPGQRSAPQLEFTVTPGRDNRPPFAFRTSGRLTPPSSVRREDACQGRVSIQVKSGKKTISNRRTQVRPDCTFQQAVKFKNRKRVGKSRSLRFIVTFQGNKVLLPQKAKPKTARVR